MRTLKMTIAGKFWDSQIYFGKLYLFKTDGSVLTLKWNDLLDEFKVEDELILALKCAFSESDYLYGYDQQRITNDPEVKPILQSKFTRLSELDLELSKAQIANYIDGEQDSPFPFPHADTYIFNRTMFSASQKGIFQANCNGKTNYPISKLVKKHTDCPTLKLSLKYNTIAFAAGEEGLFELFYGSDSIRNTQIHEPTLLTKGNFNSCDWLFWSIYGTSYNSASKLVDFSLMDDSDDDEDFDGIAIDDPDIDTDNFAANVTQERKKRSFKKRNLDRIPTRRGFKTRSQSRVIKDRSIFQGTGISWGNQDKICMVSGNTLHIAKYNPRETELRERLHIIDSVQFYAWKGEIISGAIAHFGTIVECENAMVVIPTVGDAITIPGECVTWRIFPRAKNYVNQLHIIYEDRIEIHSFNHDYFINQDEKKYGIWHHTGGNIHRR